MAMAVKSPARRPQLPVSLNYHERAPFKFSGKIEEVTIKYVQGDQHEYKTQNDH